MSYELGLGGCWRVFVVENFGVFVDGQKFGQMVDGYVGLDSDGYGMIC